MADSYANHLENTFLHWFSAIVTDFLVRGLFSTIRSYWTKNSFHTWYLKKKMGIYFAHVARAHSNICIWFSNNCVKQHNFLSLILLAEHVYYSAHEEWFKGNCWSFHIVFWSNGKSKANATMQEPHSLAYWCKKRLYCLCSSHTCFLTYKNLHTINIKSCTKLFIPIFGNWRSFFIFYISLCHWVGVFLSNFLPLYVGTSMSIRRTHVHGPHLNNCHGKLI